MTHFRSLESPSSFRKLAAAMWRPPNDPHIFGFLDIDMTNALAFLDRYNASTPHKVTVTHLVARAVALLFRKHPEMNAKVGWSRIWLRNQIDLFCQVAIEGGRDLSGVKVEQADDLCLADFAARLTASAKRIRTDQDPDFKRSRRLFETLPLWALRLLLGLMSLLCNKLNLHLPRLGMPRDPFGSAMVTSVGMFGIDTGFAPLTPIARCPMIVTVTRIKQRPWVVEDRVVPRPVLRLCATFDHRVIDGFHGGHLSTEMEQLLTHPEQLLTDEEAHSWQAPEAGRI